MLAKNISRLDARLNSARDKNGNIKFVGQDNRRLMQLIKFMQAVLDNKRTASTLAHHFQGLHSYFGLYSRDVSFAPHLQLFFDSYRDHSIRSCPRQDKDYCLEDGQIPAEVFNDFIAYMRAEGRRRGVDKKVANWERNTAENLKRLDSYVNALFESHARLLVLRIDLLYKVAALSQEEIGQIHERLLVLSDRDQVGFLEGKASTAALKRETAARVDVKEAMKDRDRFFANMRGKPSLFGHMVGFVWSLEWSRVSGYHLHCALFLDGSKAHKHEYLADEIGKYWATVITKGRGLYYNCNRDKAKYGDLWAIGPVDHHDTVKRGHLMRTLGYLAKKDQYVHVKPSAKCKLFGTGRLPGPKSRVGRPRVKQAVGGEHG